MESEKPPSTLADDASPWLRYMIAVTARLCNCYSSRWEDYAPPQPGLGLTGWVGLLLCRQCLLPLLVKVVISPALLIGGANYFDVFLINLSYLFMVRLGEASEEE